LPHYGFKNSAVFFDVGANVGDYSKEVINAYPGTQAFLFEPHPETLQKLKNDPTLNSAKKFNIAFGENNERLVFMIVRILRVDLLHASFYKEVISGIHSQAPVRFNVEVMTLDSFCSENQILQIDFLKIDTGRGHELAVLKGAKKLIAERKIKLIQFEFNEMNVVSRTYIAIRNGFCGCSSFSYVLLSILSQRRHKVHNHARTHTNWQSRQPHDRGLLSAGC
jgi:FkbM family methyltransferase